MQQILYRFPRLADRRTHVALAGFASGAALLLVLGMLATVIYTGRGYFLPPPEAEVIYPNL